MENFKIINIDEYIKARNDEIMIAKKLKTKGTDFAILKKSGYVKPKPVKVEKEIETKEEIKEIKPKVEVKEEPKEDNYDAFEKRMKALDAIYDKEKDQEKETRKAEIIKQVSKEKEEAKLTEEDYEKELNKKNDSTRIVAYKNNIKAGYQTHLNNLEAIKTRIKEITNEYANETEIGNRLEDIKKENKNVLNGINAWDMSCFEARKEDEATRSLISHIEEYFETNRKALDKVIQEIQNNNDRKSDLSKSEKHAREDQASCKKDLQKYMEETYPELVKANEKDMRLKEANAAVAELTGETEEKVPVREITTPTMHVVPEVQTAPQETERVKVMNVNNLNDTNQVYVGQEFGRVA